MLSTSSETYGQIFHSMTLPALAGGTPPSIPLPDSDPLGIPFRIFWHRHLAILTKPGGVFVSVIDALIAIARGDPSWEAKLTADDISLEQLRMRRFLAQNAPNLVLLDDFKHFGCHLRCPAIQGFIGLSRVFANQWLAAEEGSEEQLGLSAILITSIHHEMGHWIQSNKALYCSDNNEAPLNVSSTLSTPSHPSSSDNNEAPLNVSSTLSTPSHPSNTPKLLNAAWLIDGSDIGEAGNFVEFQTRGGIMQYHNIRKQPYLVVSPRGFDESLFLAAPYLRVYSQVKGPKDALLALSPAFKSESSQLYIKTKKFFPFNGDNDCSLLPTPSPSLQLQLYHGYTPTATLKL